MAPLYQGPDINRMKLTAEPSKKPASLLKPLVPSKSKLTTIEAKRVMSVLDETIHKVELVTLLSYMASNYETLEGVLGQDIMKAVSEHEDLCRSLLDTVIYLQDKERRLQEEEEYKEEGWFRDRILSIELQKSSLPPLMQQIKESTKDTLRLLLNNPQAVRLLQTYTPSRSAEAQNFIDCLIELRGFLFEKLLTGPVEARDKSQFIQDINRRNRRNQGIIDTLENELAASVKNRDAEVWFYGIGQVTEGAAQRSQTFGQWWFFLSDCNACCHSFTRQRLSLVLARYQVVYVSPHGPRLMQFTGGRSSRADLITVLRSIMKGKHRVLEDGVTRELSLDPKGQRRQSQHMKNGRERSRQER